MGLFYFHAGTCKSTDCSNNYTTRHTAHIKKDRSASRNSAEPVFYTQAHVTRNTHIYSLWISSI